MRIQFMICCNMYHAGQGIEEEGKRLLINTGFDLQNKNKGDPVKIEI